MKIIYNNIIPTRKFIAINILGIIFCRKQYNSISDTTINHEKIHTAQMKEMLYVFFYLFYISEWFIKLFFYGKESYSNISFEREAYQYDFAEDYLSKRKRFAWVKFLTLKNKNPHSHC